MFGRIRLKIQARGTALGSRLSALGSRLSALGSRLSALGSRLSALGSRLSALGSRLSALGSRLSALGSRLSALGSRLSALGSHNESQRTKPLLSSLFSSHSRLFPNPAPLRPGNRVRKATGPIVHNVVCPPISEAPHETGVSGFVDVSKDTDHRDSVRNFERVHVRPVPAPLQPKRTSTGS